jgi:hypothetical protein
MILPDHILLPNTHVIYTYIRIYIYIIIIIIIIIIIPYSYYSIISIT